MKVITEPKLLSVLPEDGAEAKAPSGGEGSSVAGFGDMLKQAISQVNQRLKEADELANRLAMGEHVDIAQVMSAMAKADISFRLLLQVRNKALNAYEEIMRMQF